MKTRIAHFIDSLDSGGAETMVVDLCNYLNQSGFETIIYHIGNDLLKQYCHQYDIQNQIVPCVKYYKSFKYLPLFIHQFKKFLLKEKINILHSHLFGAVTAGSFSCYLGKIPHIGTLHDVYTIEEKPFLIHLLKFAIRLNTQLITVSKHMEDVYHKAGLTRNSLQTIYNGVEPNSVLPDLKLKKTLNLKDDDIVLICVGRLIPIKQVDIIVNVCLKLMETYSNIKLLIVGSGSESEKIYHMISESKYPQNFRLLGERNDVKHLLAISDIFIQFSTTEGLSISILEAMATALPCVVSNVGGNSELVKEGFNGYLVQGNNQDELYKKLKLLLHDSSIKDKGMNSLKIIDELFNKKIPYNKYIEIYKKLTKPPIQ